MKIDIIYLAVLVGLFVYGFNVPFVLAMLYIFLDFLPYQHISTWIFPSIPFSKIFAIGFFLSFFLFEVRKALKPNLIHVLLVLFVAWFTLTCTWAVAPGGIAWNKWDWVFKSVIAASFVSFMLTSRERIEALLWTITFSAGASVIVAGLKGVFGGGGYGSLRRLIPNYDSGIGETSILSMVAIALLPIIGYLAKHGTLMPRHVVVRIGMIGLMALAPFAVIATYARAGLVAMAAWALIAWFGSKRKIMWVVLGTVALVAAGPYLPEAWLNRMNTIGSYEEEGSAAGRLAVWMWTLDFVSKNPFGGGFDAYVVNGLMGFTRMADGSYQATSPGGAGKAFHSIYFELLGEQGILGFGLYMTIQTLIMLKIFRLHVRTRRVPGLEWAHDLSYAIFVSLTVYLVGGAFVGVAYQTWAYLLISATIGLDHVVRQHLGNARAPAARSGGSAFPAPEPALQGAVLRK